VNMSIKEALRWMAIGVGRITSGAHRGLAFVALGRLIDELKRLRRIERAARKWDRAAGSVARRAAAVLALEQVLYETKKGKAVRRANRCVEVKP